MFYIIPHPYPFSQNDFWGWGFFLLCASREPTIKNRKNLPVVNHALHAKQQLITYFLYDFIY